MGKHKTAWIVILISVLVWMVGFYVAPTLAAPPSGWLSNYNWQGQGAYNYGDSNTTPGSGLWWDSLRYAFADVTPPANHDGVTNVRHYNGRYTSWSSETFAGHTHYSLLALPQSPDSLGYNPSASSTFSGSDFTNVQLSNTSRTSVYFNVPNSVEAVGARDSDDWNGTTYVNNMLIDGGSWSFGTSAALYPTYTHYRVTNNPSYLATYHYTSGTTQKNKTLHGVGVLYLDGVNLSFDEDVTFTFDRGIQVYGGASTFFIIGNNLNPFGIYNNDYGIYGQDDLDVKINNNASIYTEITQYDPSVPSLTTITRSPTYVVDDGTILKDPRYSHTLFIDTTTTIRREANVNIHSGMQNRTSISPNQTLNFAWDKDMDFKIFNVNTYDEIYENTTDYSDFGQRNIFGGAFYLGAGADIKKLMATTGPQYYGLLEITENKARQGGAFYSVQNLTIEGNTHIYDNEAVEDGGAIYMAGNHSENVLTFDTTHGHIALEGNTENTGDTARPNSIFLEKNIDMKVIGSGTYIGNLYINDGINTGLTTNVYGNNSLTVNLESTKNNYIQFGENSVSLLNSKDNPGGKVTITNGVFRILEEGEFRTQGNDAEFTVTALGTLAGQGLIEAQHGFIINGTLAPDSYVYEIPTDLKTETVGPSSGTTIGFLTLEGNLTLKNSKLAVQFTNLQLKDSVTSPSPPTATGITQTNIDSNILQSDMVVVKPLTYDPSTGKIILSGKNTVDLFGQTWQDGQFVIAAAKNGIFNTDNEIITLDNIANYFSNINLPDLMQNPRRNATLSIETNLLGDIDSTIETDLLLTTSTHDNVKLVWTSAVAGHRNIWNDGNSATPYTNWARIDDNGTIMKYPNTQPIELPFKKGDIVYFNVSQNKGEFIVNPTDSWTVGGMVIEGGSYTFEGTNAIIIKGSTTDSKGVIATGRLDIKGTDTTATETNVKLGIHTDFERGIRIGNFDGTRLANVNVALAHTDSLGIYPAMPSATNERGAVYIDKSDATITATYIAGQIERILKNHFELTGESTLNLDTTGLGKLTIQEVDTSNSALPADRPNAKHQGGAIYIGTGSEFSRSGNPDTRLTFQNNKAQEGGAIYVDGENELTITGNTVFQNNTAVENGGAIFLGNDSTLTLSADNGDIVFSGNKSKTTLDPDSIYLEGGNTITIDGGYTVYFDDPISYNYLSNKGNNFVMNGGVVQFKGDSTLNPNTFFDGGVVDINSGTFRIADNGKFYTGSQWNTAQFHVSDGATLAGNGEIIVVKDAHNSKGFAGFQFDSGSKISPDANVLVSDLIIGTPVTNSLIGKLKLDGSVLLDGAVLEINVGNTSGISGTTGNTDFIEIAGGSHVWFNSVVTIDVIPVTGADTTDGEYKILSGAQLYDIGGNLVTDATNVDLLVAPIEGSSRTSSAKVEIRNNGKEIWLVEVGALINMKLFWTGGTGAFGSAWDVQNTTNWSDKTDQLPFVNNDSIAFDDEEVIVQNYNVTLTEDVTVKEMSVLGGDYTITSATGKTISSTTPITGKLIVGGKTVAGTPTDATVTLGVETNFIEGTELRNNGKIVIANEKALGTYNHVNFATDKQGYVDVTGNGTIGTNDPNNNYTVNNRFNVADGQALTFDIAAGEKLTLNGSTASDVVLANNATLNKTGTGTLVFTGNKNAGFITESVAGEAFIINATQGDIVFTNNPSGDAINNPTGTVALTGTNNGRIYLGDSINATNFNLTGTVTAIFNTNPTNTISTATIGTDAGVKSILHVNATNTFNATTFNLKKGAEITGNGTINATTISLHGTLNPSSDAFSLDTNNFVTSTTNTALTTLTFTGTTTTLDGATLKLDLANPNQSDKIHVAGTLTFGITKNKIDVIHTGTFTNNEVYTVLTTTSTLPSLSDLETKYFDLGTVGSGDKRSSYELVRKDNNTLQIKTKSGGNLEIYWTGYNNSSDDSKWYLSNNQAHENWVAPESGNTPQYFLGGDTVNFNNENYVRTNNVTLENDNHTVKDMFIYGGGDTYVFDSEGNGNKAKITGTGDLNIGSDKNNNQSSGNADFGVELDFAGDVNIVESDVTFEKKLTVGGKLFIDPSNVTFNDEVKVTGITEIKDEETSVTYNEKITTEQLVIQNAAVTLNDNNTFTQNTELYGTATVILGNNNALGTKEVDVKSYTDPNTFATVTADATITTNKENLTIANDIKLENDAKLTLETEKDNTLTYSGTFTSTTNNTLTKSGEGTVEISTDQNFNANTVISEGVLKLNDDFKTTGTFTIEEDAILTSDNNITVDAGSFDIKGTVKVENGNKLDLAGNVNLTKAILNIKLAETVAAIPIDVTGSVTVLENGNIIDVIGDWADIEADKSYFIIATTTGIILNSGLEEGFLVANNGELTGARQDHTLERVDTDGISSGTKVLKLTVKPLENLKITWTGQGNEWNKSTENWKDESNNETYFMDGDFVVFNSNNAQKQYIYLYDKEHIVSGMTVGNGNFMFSGAKTLNGNTTIGNYSNPTGRLDFEGTGTTELYIATNFQNGINITGTREIVIGNDEALGNTENKVEIKNDSSVTLKNDGEERKIKSNVTLGTNTTLIVDTTTNDVNTITNDLAFNGTLTGNGTTFIKNGTGSVAFAGNNNTLDANGNATINAGIFRVENSNDSFNAGKQFILKTNATVTGNGKITANTIELAGNIAPGTDGVNDGVGTLTFDGNTTTTFNGANLFIDLKTGNVSDKIIVLNGTADINHANTVTVKNLKTGNYTIIEASQGSSSLLGDVNNWEKILPTTAKRASAELLRAGNLVQLIVNVDNLRLSWNGNKDNIWNVENTQNWTNDETKEDDQIFMTLDTVTFNGRGQGDVEVIDSGVTVAGMNIKNGEYHFTGGNIRGEVGTVGDGNLNISGGEISFTQLVSFDGGINIDGNAKVTLLTQYGGQFNSGDDFFLGPNATLNFVPETKSIVADGDVDLQGTVNVGIPESDRITDVIVSRNGELNQEQLHSKFDRTWGLNRWEAIFENEDDSSMDLFYEPITPYDFAKHHGLGWNMTEAARAVTEISLSKKIPEQWQELYQGLFMLDTDEKVISVLNDLRGTEQAADALTIALWDPWTKVYQQLIKRDNNTTPIVRANGQAPGTFQFKNRNVWIESYYRYTDVNGDNNAKKYYENRGGLMLGLDTKVAYSTSLGIAFGFGDPKLSSKFGKVEADDYTLALYSHTRISDYRLNTFFGFGTQEFKYQRNDWLGNLFGDGGLHKAGYDGNALYASAELLRPFNWSNSWTLYPTIALDYQRSWTYSFTEQGGLFGQSVRKGNADRFIGRVGLDSKFSYSNYLNILTRLQAGYLVGGDTYTSIRSSFTGATPVMSLHGVNLGRTQFNLGIGGEWFVDEIKSLKFFGNYDLDFGKRHAMQTLQIGAHITF